MSNFLNTSSCNGGCISNKYGSPRNFIAPKDDCATSAGPSKKLAALLPVIVDCCKSEIQPVTVTKQLVDVFPLDFEIHPNMEFVGDCPTSSLATLDTANITAIPDKSCYLRLNGQMTFPVTMQFLVPNTPGIEASTDITVNYDFTFRAPSGSATNLEALAYVTAKVLNVGIDLGAGLISITLSAEVEMYLTRNEAVYVLSAGDVEMRDCCKIPEDPNCAPGAHCRPYPCGCGCCGNPNRNKLYYTCPGGSLNDCRRTVFK